MAQIKSHNISGKSTDEMYVDIFPKIYAAGIRRKQPDVRVVDCLNDILVPNSVNETKTNNMQFRILGHARSTVSNDMRNAGPFTESSDLIHPPVLTHFQTLVNDLKETVYESYWNKQVGQKPDLSCCIPPGFDVTNTTFGKSTKNIDNAYDIIMPKRCLSNELDTISSKSPGYQLQRNYCKPSFNPNITNGVKTNAGQGGQLIKKCLTDDRIYTGTFLKQPTPIVYKKFQQRVRSELETCLSPNENIKRVPEGHAFGKAEAKDRNNVLGCLTYCEINPEKELLQKCLAHLNTLRKCISKRFDGTFFQNFYLHLKYLDNSLCGWLPKEIVYHSCTTKHIQFIPSLIEPLLKIWEVIYDTNIEYKKFINIIDFRQPLPTLPKVWITTPEYTDFNTTYKTMVMPQPQNKDLMAGMPSGRYFDSDYPVTPDDYCKADRSYLPQESDARACLNPSIFTTLGVSHRDMYAERDPEKVKRVFQAAGEDINEQMFNVVWDCATKYHSKGLVCYETFRCALKEYKNKLNHNST